MALTSASQGASATPATDLYTTLAALMTTWTLVETATAGQAGTTDIVKVWRNSTTKVYVLIEVDDTNARLRFRCSEGYDATTHTVIHPCPGVQSNTANTPNANDSVTATEDANDVTIFQAQGTTSKVGWVNIPVSAGGFNYVVGANDNEVVLSTSATQQNWVHAGRIPAADLFSPDSTIVFLGGRATLTDTNVSWTMAAATGWGNYRVSREPNQGAVALSGAFCYIGEAVSTQQDGVALGLGGQPGFNHKWLTSFAAYQAYLHGSHNTVANSGIRTHLGKLASMAVCGHDSVSAIAAATTVGDTITVDGTIYYSLGPSHIVSNAIQQWQCRIMLAKSSAF